MAGYPPDRALPAGAGLIHLPSAGKPRINRRMAGTSAGEPPLCLFNLPNRME
jgi:hypothetical protein